MAKQKFVHYVPREKPPKRPGRHKKDLTKTKKEVIRSTTDKENNYELFNKNTSGSKRSY